MRRDKVELFRYEPTAERTVETPVLIVYGMIGHCCPPDRSRVRNPLARGIDPFAGEIIRMVFNRQRRKAMPHAPNLATTNSVANEGKTVKIQQRSTENDEADDKSQKRPCSSQGGVEASKRGSPHGTTPCPPGSAVRPQER